MVATSYRVQAFCLTLVLTCLPAVANAAGWFDDFNDGDAEDGNPVTWTYNELGATPGVYSASSGDFELSAPGMTNDDNLLTSVNQTFTDTYVRTQAYVAPGPGVGEDGGNVGVLARYDPSTISGYAAVIDDGSFYGLFRVDFGTAVGLASADDLTINAVDDVLVELHAIGDQLSLYLWKPDEEKPSSPIVTVTDGTYSSGRAGLVYNEDDDNTIGVYRYAAAQDTPFVDAAPGDFNDDGVVNGEDHIVWQRDLADAASLALWEENFGAGAAAVGAAAVPEPGAGLLALLTITGYMMRRRA